MEQELRMRSMGSNILGKKVHTDLTQGQEPGPISPYYSSPITITCTGPVLV